uniref:Caspase 9 n=1 Tax=Cebus imitator TaxID=2715852 RepID=A0A2K5PNB7_CEBIM
MDEADRLLLRRHRRLLVEKLQVDQLWDALLSRELFKPHMIEDIQRAGCGSRRDQARQLITDLESRGSQAFPLFISCLEETGQCMLASILQTNRQTEKFLIPKPKDPRPVDIGSGGSGDGEQKDHGFEVASTSPEEESPGSNPESDATPFQEDAWTFDQVDAVSSLPTPSDIFVSYSTFPGFVSWREPKRGSWYVETLDDIFEHWAHSEDLQSLLLRVANAVSGKGIYKQMPGFFNFLRKKLFFKTS